MKVKKTKSKVGFQQIYKELKEDILSGKITYGHLLVPEKVMAEQMQVSRPTISKVYNNLQAEGLVKKRAGFGTSVVYKMNDSKYRFGLLLPGSGESEIFSTINDQFLYQSKKRSFDCLWEGTVANNAEMRKGVTLKICQTYIERNADGIFFAPLERTPANEKLNEEICTIIDKAGIPLILIDRDIYPFPQRSPYDLVCIDNFHAGYMMAEHLIQAGCETIHFFFRPDSAHSLDLRIEGVRAAMAKYNLSFHNGNVFCGDPADLGIVKKMKVVPFKTGIICGNDSTAAVLLSSLEDLHLEITSDVLIAGYDNMKYGTHLRYPLTTYQQPCEEMVEVSMNLMFIKLGSMNQSPVTINLYGTIIPRASTVFQTP